MSKRAPKSGVQKNRRGRPKGQSLATTRRSTFARIARDAGMPDETIVGAVEQLAPTAETRKHLRQKVTRWTRPVTPSDRATDWKARQAAYYASRAVGESWLGVSRERGWNDPDAASLSAAELEALAVKLTLQATAVRACKAANLFLVPIPIDLDEYYELISDKVGALRQLSKQAERKQTSRRKELVQRQLQTLSNAQYAQLSASQQREYELALGLDVPDDRPTSSDALSRLQVPYREV